MTAHRHRPSGVATELVSALSVTAVGKVLCSVKHAAQDEEDLGCA